jgi:hypothetical protein
MSIAVALEMGPDTGLDKWKEGIRKAATDPRWSVHDCDIQNTVSLYNRHLDGVAGYRPLEWQFIKTMAWVETGASSPQWNTRPLQIGVSTDPGLGALLANKEGGNLIVPPGMIMTSATTIPAHNIRAAVGYLLMRMANFDIQSIPGADTALRTEIVKDNDNLSKIAARCGTTLEVLQKMNPQAKILKKGQTLQYRKAAMGKVITGWRAFTATEVARRYNGGGDPNYATKIEYALPLARGAKAAACK